MEKKSFLIHKDSLHILDELTNEQAGQLFKAIRDIQNGGEYSGDALIKIALVPFIQQFKRDNEKWEGINERNSINGAKGGRPSKSASNNETKENPKNPMGYSETQENPTEPKKAVSVSDSVSVNDSDSDNVLLKKETKKFVKPSIDEVKEFYKTYLASLNRVLPESELLTKANTFVNHYESNGWKVGRNSMKNWQATVRNWITRENGPTTQTQKPTSPHEAQQRYDKNPIYT